MISPSDPDLEKRFLEEECAGALRRIRVARRELGKGARPGARAAGALKEISRATRDMERSLYWFGMARAAAILSPVAPWPASSLAGLARQRIRASGLSLGAPAGRPGGRLTLPTDPLLIGLLGAAQTLKVASGSQPTWVFESSPGLLFTKLAVPGSAGLLDPEPLVCRYHWPGVSGGRSGADAGVAYLAAVVSPFAGEVELIWAKNRWRLECAVPLI